MPLFQRYIGIDYSGAKTPTSRLKGLRVYEADRSTEPQEVHPPQSPRKDWIRRGIAEWLVEQLSGEIPIIVGIDHAFSFPMAYFTTYGLRHGWSLFLDDFSSTGRRIRSIHLWNSCGRERNALEIHRGCD